MFPLVERRYKRQKPFIRLKILVWELEISMEYKCVELETIDGLKYFIDNPKAGQVVDCDRLKISGWAFDATTTKPTLVIDTGSHFHRLEVRQP